ncbi:MAG: hypothetical protein ABS81_14240 [Pseudonocardia sp. SCN 72-86]|nr:MAG: hypothetical protein ABS81_14240 [Pseudonocardia sp. SCN 72-86]
MRVLEPGPGLTGRAPIVSAPGERRLPTSSPSTAAPAPSLAVGDASRSSGAGSVTVDDSTSAATPVVLRAPVASPGATARPSIASGGSGPGVITVGRSPMWAPTVGACRNRSRGRHTTHV